MSAQFFSGQEGAFYGDIHYFAAPGTQKMVMRGVVVIVSGFGAGDGYRVYEPLLEKRIQGIINRGFGDGGYLPDQSAIYHLGGGVDFMTLQIFHNPQPLIGGLETFGLQNTLDMLRICIHFIFVYDTN